MAGYIKIYRKLLDWGWYNDTAVKGVFLHLLLTANFRSTEYHGRTIERGQAVFGRESLAAAVGITVQQARTALKKLKSTGEITVQPYNKFSVATIQNFELYQGNDADTEQIDENQQSTNNQPSNNHQITINQPTDNHQITTSEEIKKGRNKESKEKSIKEKFGVLENVLLTREEFEKLKERFPSDYLDRIANLSYYLASSGKKYKSHYATILSWAAKDKEQGKTAKRGSVYSAEGASFDLDEYEKRCLFEDE